MRRCPNTSRTVHGSWSGPGHGPARGSDQVGLKKLAGRLGSGGVRNLTGRIGSGRIGSGRSGRVGSDRVGQSHPDTIRSTGEK